MFSCLQHTRDDELSVAHLQKEADEAWKLVEQARENESKLKEQVEELRVRVHVCTNVCV